MSDGWIRVSTLSVEGRKTAQRISRSSRLHEGEAESIALAHARRDLLIVDDKEARAVAEAMRLDYLGTAAVLLHGFLEGHFEREELAVLARPDVYETVTCLASTGRARARLRGSGAGRYRGAGAPGLSDATARSRKSGYGARSAQPRERPSRGVGRSPTLEEAVEELARTIWLSPAVVTEVLRRAREASK